MTDHKDQKPLKIPTKDKIGPAPMKRFYREVATHQVDGGWQVRLDGRPMKSPAGHLLMLPAQKLAQKLASEWAGQGEYILLETMPFTRLAYHCCVEDEKILQEARAEIISYGLNDLILYRSETPQDLKTRQEILWNPVLDWLKQDFGLVFNVVSGIMHVRQPDETHKKFSRILDPVTGQALPALLMMTKITGSALLSLACVQGVISKDQAWKAASVDENYQMEIWGEDDEARHHLKLKQNDFDVAADYFELCLPDMAHR